MEHTKENNCRNKEEVDRKILYNRIRIKEKDYMSNVVLQTFNWHSKYRMGQKEMDMEINV